MPDNDTWPRCPECGARRVVRCPICQTSGTDFPQADPAYVGTPDTAEPAGPVGCSCGAGGCLNGGDEIAEEGVGWSLVPIDGEIEVHAGVNREPRMLVCPTCDEPLVPEYPRRCEWCGYEFSDGFEVDSLAGPAAEPLTGRAVAVMIGLTALGLALLAYFLWLV